MFASNVYVNNEQRIEIQDDNTPSETAIGVPKSQRPPASHKLNAHRAEAIGHTRGP